MKGGLKCSTICVFCQGVSCSNSATLAEEEEEDEILDESEIQTIDMDDREIEDAEEHSEGTCYITGLKTEESKSMIIQDNSYGKSRDSETNEVNILPFTSAVMDRPRKSARKVMSK